ncbi:hypothetical protein [Natronococcus sp. JC468]|nr:hypothetical protein [Natronococcus sp. JC468]
MTDAEADRPIEDADESTETALADETERVQYVSPSASGIDRHY